MVAKGLATDSLHNGLMGASLKRPVGKSCMGHTGLVCTCAEGFEGLALNSHLSTRLYPRSTEWVRPG